MAKQHMMPADIATRLNDELCEGNENGMFVTMFLALIDLKTGSMNFCNAGHNPPVLGDKFMEIETNAPIGLWPGLEFVGESVDNIEGKSLFLYSDGLNEAEDKEQVQFGDDHLLAILKEMHFDNARQVIEYMRDAVEKHRKGALPNDDLTMMELKFNKNDE
jgi:serine phosphatase RsbU (regulator of sigma subunit)